MFPKFYCRTDCWSILFRNFTNVSIDNNDFPILPYQNLRSGVIGVVEFDWQQSRWILTSLPIFTTIFYFQLSDFFQEN